MICEGVTSNDMTALQELMLEELGLPEHKRSCIELENGGITFTKQQGLRKGQPVRAWRVPGMGTQTVYKIHDNNIQNLLRSILTRVLIVKYKKATLDHRLERDRRRIRETIAYEWNMHPDDVNRGVVEEHGCLFSQWKFLDNAEMFGMGPPFPPVEGIFESKGLREFRRSVLDEVPFMSPCAVDKFHEYFEGRKRELYRLAGKSFETIPLCENDFEIGAFLKREKINFSSKSDPDPRIIQPSSVRALLTCGRWLKPTEGPLCKAIGKVWGHPTISKGMNASQVGNLIREKWLMFDNPVAIGIDAARFDQHASVAIQKYTQSFYKSIYAGHPERAELDLCLENQLHTEGRSFVRDGKCKFRRDGGNTSGKPNTALDNCVQTTALCYEFVHDMGVKAALINNGDDCVLFCERRDEKKLTDKLYGWFCDRGFTMEVEDPVYELEKVVFCQASPYFDGTGWRMIRDPHTTLSKDSMSIIPLESELSYGAWIKAVGECGLALAGDVPIYGSFYNCLVRNGTRLMRGRSSNLHKHQLMASGMTYLAKDMHYKYAPPTQEGRASFYFSYGVLPAVQQDLEAYYDAKILEWGEVVTENPLSVPAAQSHTATGQLL